MYLNSLELTGMHSDLLTWNKTISIQKGEYATQGGGNNDCLAISLPFECDLYIFWYPVWLLLLLVKY